MIRPLISLQILLTLPLSLFCESAMETLPFEGIWYEVIDHEIGRYEIKDGAMVLSTCHQESYPDSFKKLYRMKITKGSEENYIFTMDAVLAPDPDGEPGEGSLVNKEEFIRTFKDREDEFVTDIEIIAESVFFERTTVVQILEDKTKLVIELEGMEAPWNLSSTLPAELFADSTEQGQAPPCFTGSEEFFLKGIRFYEMKQNVQIPCYMSGKVSRYSHFDENETGFGKYLELEHEVASLKGSSGKSQGTFYTLYGMLDALFIQENTEVERQEPVGLPGGSSELSLLSEGNFFLGVWSYEEKSLLKDYFGGDAPVFAEGVYWYNPQRLTE